MILKCIAIDDEQPALEKLKSYISRIPYLELIGVFDNAADAGKLLEERDDIEVFFIDINMPDMNGIEFVKSLGERRQHVVFITAYTEYAIESYRTGAVDYLLKPYSFEDFSRACGRLVEYSVATGRNDGATNFQVSEKSFFVKVDTRWIRLKMSDIEYISGYGDYLRIYISERNTPLVTYSTLSSILEMLSEDFLQVHRSYIVNMSGAVSSVERNKIILGSGQEIPIGNSFRDKLAAYLAEHSIGKESRKRI